MTGTAAILTVARKELRTYFQSATALIFLGIFLAVTQFTFFTWSGFFARNIADVRPLFEWLPLLLIFLVAAITMRQWAEEKKMGTLEVLLTLPLSTRDLVLGKFAAGLALVGVGLALTLPLPLTAAALGQLDWGPVIGGYVGALLLGGMYMSIGLCISARTDNQVVALMMTLVVGGLLYLVGTERVLGLVGSDMGELMRALGSGARFESIERGVIDLRDLFYYGSITAFFLTLNVYFLETARIDAAATSGRTRQVQWLGTLGLVALNVVVGNVWLAPVSALRADLTEHGDYSVSKVTVDTLRQLDEPLVIHGYFSERTHPKLAPLIPQVVDLLKEYEVNGAGKVEVQIIDPNDDEELEQEIVESYGIRSVPFAVTDRHQQSVINSYFHILVRYADKYQVLSFEELIEVRSDADQNIEIRLRNLEYDLTRTIKKVSQEFETLDTILAKLQNPAKITAYITPDSLPKDYSELPERFDAVGKEIQKETGGKLLYERVDPQATPGMAESLFETYKIQPLAADLFGQQRFYLHLVLQVGDRTETIQPRGDLAEADIRKAIEASVKRAVPGQLKTIGFYTETPEAPPPNPQIPPQFQPPPPRPDYSGLQRYLANDYTVEPVDLTKGFVPEHIDIFVVGKVGALDEKQKFALDQYLMRGGKVIALAGRYKVEVARGALTATKQPAPLYDLLSAWGADVGQELVMDEQNAPFPIPVQRRQGGIVFRTVEMMPYPFFPDVRQDGFDQGHAAVAGLNNLTMPWSSPVTANAGEGVKATTLVSTSDKAWLNTTGTVAPDPEKYPKTGFPMPVDASKHGLVVTLEGPLNSYYADKPSPMFKGSGAEGEDATGRTLKQALPGARLAVIGTSELVSDFMLQAPNMLSGEVHRNNIQLVHNLVDWSLEDTDLLQIRSSGAFARTLRPMEEDERWMWEAGHYGFTLLAMFALFVLPQRRRLTKPIALPKGVN